MRPSENSAARPRISYLDTVRILACILVVFVHVSAQELTALPKDSADFFITNAFNCLGFTGVALFAMISGALLLREEASGSLKKLLFHGTLRLFFLYYVWKALYQFVFLWEHRISLTPAVFKNDVLLALVKQRGYYHLWFIPMLAILYMTVPLIKKSVCDRSVCRYFLTVFFVTALLVPTLLSYEFKFKYLVVDFFTANDFSFFGGYLGYFILGHTLNRFPRFESPSRRPILYLSGGACFALSCMLGFLDSCRLGEGEVSSLMNTPFTPFTFVTAAALFTACRSLTGRSDKMRNSALLPRLSGLTFGIYLLHPCFLLLFSRLGLRVSFAPPLLGIPLITALLILVCGAVSALMLRIPGLRRLIR